MHGTGDAALLDVAPTATLTGDSLVNVPTLVLSSLAALGLLSIGGPGIPPMPTTAASAALQNPSTGGGQTFTLQSLKGRHGFTYSGSRSGVGAIASSGAIDFDGHGHLAARYTTSINGIAFTGNFIGTYTVNPDGTGAVVLTLALLGLQANGNFVLVDHGDATFFTSTDAGFSVTGSTRKM